MSRSRRGGGTRTRAFYALPLPPEVAGSLAAWGERCAAADRGLRATPPPRLHVTVAFLGERPTNEVDALAAALDGGPGPWVPLRTDAARRLADDRVLAAVLADPEGAYATLARRTAAAAGLPAPRRPLPHVSVARGRPDDVRPAGPGSGAPPPPVPAETWVADRLELWSSELRPEGPRYRVLAASGGVGGS